MFHFVIDATMRSPDCRFVKDSRRIVRSQAAGKCQVAVKQLNSAKKFASTCETVWSLH